MDVLLMVQKSSQPPVVYEKPIFFLYQLLIAGFLKYQQILDGEMGKKDDLLVLSDTPWMLGNTKLGRFFGLHVGKYTRIPMKSVWVGDFSKLSIFGEVDG